MDGETKFMLRNGKLLVWSEEAVDLGEHFDNESNEIVYDMGAGWMKPSEYQIEQLMDALLKQRFKFRLRKGA